MEPLVVPLPASVISVIPLAALALALVLVVRLADRLRPVPKLELVRLAVKPAVP